MASALIPAIATSAAGKLLSAAGGGQAAAYNAKVADQNAALARQQGEIEAQQLLRQGRKAVGSMRAAYGASGVSMSGSALDVLMDTEQQVTLDALTAKYNATLRAKGFDDQARLERRREKMAVATGLLKVGATVVGGVGKSINLKSAG